MCNIIFYIYIYIYPMQSIPIVLVDCNPSLTQIYIKLNGGATTPNATATSNSTGAFGSQVDAISIISLVIWFVAIIYSRWDHIVQISLHNLIH